MVPYCSLTVTEKCFHCSSANGSGTVDFELDEAKLQVDFNAMKQKNLDTNFIRSVRCAVSEKEGISFIHIILCCCFQKNTISSKIITLLAQQHCFQAHTSLYNIVLQEVIACGSTVA